MVNRCGFYTDGVNVICKTCAIEWDKGFDRQAKRTYIMSIKAELPKELHPMEDVTSASASAIGRYMSPIFIGVEDKHGKVWSLEDLCKENVALRNPGFFDFVYINALSDEQKRFIQTTNCFIDVFHNPDKGRNTQASACAYYKLLNWQRKEHLLKDLDAFLEWYKSVPYYCI